MKCFKMGIVLLFLLIFNCDQFVKADEAEVVEADEAQSVKPDETQSVKAGKAQLVKTSKAQLVKASKAQDVKADKADKDSILVDGDLMIIALFPIHHKECKQIQERAGVQRVEVALQKIDEINRGKDKEKDCTFGIYIKDTSAGYYSTDTLEQELKPIDSKRIVGMIGPATTEETSPYVRSSFPSNLYVHIGYGATSSQLITTGKPENAYPSFSPRNNFVRVVPSDKDQVKAIIEIVKTFPNCIAINVVSSPDQYGEDGADEFKRQSKNTEVCVHRHFKADSTLRNSNYFKVLNDTAHVTQVLVCFCDGDILREILSAVKKSNMTRKFIFIATDRWAERDHVLNGFENEAEGNFLINIKPQNYFSGNIDYSSMKSKNTPWIAEFENLPTCGNDSDTQCKDNKYWKYDPKLAFVSQSIQIIADLVGNKKQGNCQLQREKPFDPHGPFGPHGSHGYGPSLYPYRQPSWKDAYTSSTIDPDSTFDHDGNPKSSRYEIFYCQNANGAFKLESIGTWEKDKLNSWNNDSVKAQSRPIPKFNANCRNDCTPGERIDKTACCWVCRPCLINTYTKIGNETECDECPQVKKANPNHTGCVPKDVERIFWHETDALICMTVSTFGILVTLLSAFIFYQHVEAPIIKYSSPKLALIMFGGMILAYGYAFLLIIKPHDILCYIIKFWNSIGLTMIYGPLLARTNRTSRAYTVTKLKEPYLKREYFLTTFLVKIVIYWIIAEVMMIGVVDFAVYQSANVTDINAQHVKIIKYFCQRDETNQFNSRQLINVLLLIYSCVFAFKTIKLPDNFYESKFIVGSCICTMLIWLIYIPIFSAKSFTTRAVQIALSLVLSASAFTCLAGFIFPKLYIILWHPEKYKTYLPKESLQRDVATTDSGVAMDISIWEYLGVASRITPDIIDEAELKSTSTAGEAPAAKV